MNKIFCSEENKEKFVNMTDNMTVETIEIACRRYNMFK